MSKENSKTQIIIAIISGLALIIVAIIQFHPWHKDSSQQSKPKAANAYILAGTVVDETSEKSVGVAEITIVGRNEQYYTEENGNFKLTIKDSIPSVRIRVIKSGFTTYDKTYDLPNESILIPLTKNP